MPWWRIWVPYLGGKLLLRQGYLRMLSCLPATSSPPMSCASLLKFLEMSAKISAIYKIEFIRGYSEVNPT